MNDLADQRKPHVDIEDKPVAIGALKAVGRRHQRARQRQPEQLPADQFPVQPRRARRQPVKKHERPEPFAQQPGSAA
jgi:hypothetical protein